MSLGVAHIDSDSLVMLGHGAAPAAADAHGAGWYAGFCCRTESVQAQVPSKANSVSLNALKLSRAGSGAQSVKRGVLTPSLNTSVQ